MSTDYWVGRSWATEPLFFVAPSASDRWKARPYQSAGVEYALARRNCLIGDAPGVGKTAQAIFLSNALEANRTLVVCPGSLRENWEREIWRFSNKPNVSTYVVAKSRDGVSPKADYVIISYDLLRNADIMRAILSVTWDNVVLDEAHAIKDPRGNKRTVPLCAPNMIPSVAGRFTLLSGTILPNTPVEVYNTARLLDWSSIDRMSLEDFRDYYYAEGGGMVRSPVWDEKLQAKVSKVHWSEHVRNQPRNLDELQRRLRGSFMIRRLKSQVLKDLPEKQFHLVPLAITSEMRTALKHPGWGIAQSLVEMNPDDFAGQAAVDGAVSTARRLLGEAKAGPICDYIDELMAEGTEKLVVAAYHTGVLHVLRERLSKYGLVYMDGSIHWKKRQPIVDRFQNDPKIRIILGQSGVMGEGFTLAVAQDAVLAEPDWVPGRIEQVSDRIHRSGQEGDHVTIHLPVVPGTMDERIIATAVEKAQDIYAALDKRPVIGESQRGA